MRAVVDVFELPRRLGILQYVEYEKTYRYEGWIRAVGCKKGVCIKYHVFGYSENPRAWRIKRLRRLDREEGGGCLKQQVADAVWELVERGFEVGLWYEPWEKGYVCGVVVNGVRLYQPNCKTAEECAKALLEGYKSELKKPEEDRREEERDPAEELLRDYPELEVFGMEWVGRWLYVGERLVELAKALRRHPWMAEVLKQRRVVNPFQLEVLEAADGSEACIGLDGSYWCANNGMAREAKLELERARWEQRGDRIRPVYRPKGLMAFTEGLGNTWRCCNQALFPRRLKLCLLRIL